MELIRGLKQLQASHRPSVASIGNYDGVHLGHQHVIETLLRKSRELSAPSTVITFEPLAKEYFRPNSVPRITSVEERAELLFDLGVDRVLCVAFNADFAAYSPEGFIQDVLVDGLGIKYLCVGDDFRFGKDRVGDFAMLQRAGAKQGFAVTAHETFEMFGERVSSGRVRDALANSDFELAEKLLGRPFAIAGTVVKGQQLGRTIDFPTANIVLPSYQMPVSGVFAVTVSHPKYGDLGGVANIGTRPTVDGSENRLEVHLFDFADDIYGDSIRVRLVSKIRGEHKFPSVEQLKQQIELDANTARARLKEY